MKKNKRLFKSYSKTLRKTTKDASIRALLYGKVFFKK